MKVDFNKRFKDLKGQPLSVKELINGVEVENQSAPIYELLAGVLFSLTSREDRKYSPDEKVRMYLVSQKLMIEKGVIELTAEDATLIKEVAASYWPAGLYGQIYELVEQK
jgi:hypothetical protein